MKTIPLSKGKVAIVDEDMYDHIVSNNWKFYFADQGKSQNHRGDAKRAIDDARLHRLVLEYHGVDIPSGMDVDHKNGDRLDNRFENLQLLSRRENLLKKKRTYVNETGYRGVIVRRDGRSSGTRYRAYAIIKVRPTTTVCTAQLKKQRVHMMNLLNSFKAIWRT